MDKNTPTNTEWITNPHCPDKDREAMALKWIRSAERLRNRSSGRIRQAMSVGPLYYIDQYGALGAPIKNSSGDWGIKHWNAKKDGFLLVPLVQSDAELHPFFAEKLKNPSYSEGPRAIFLPPDRFSQVWRGLILYHEIGHTVFHRLNIHRDKKMGHWMEEYEIYKKEIQLVRKLYGRRYSRFVYRLSKQFESELRAKKLRIQDQRAVPRKDLERLFGKSQSQLEGGIQRSMIILDALYHALDRIHRSGDKSEHYEITKWFCGKSQKSESAQSGQ